jgi:hypothetical protein
MIKRLKALIRKLFEYFKYNIPARVIFLLWVSMFVSVSAMLFSSDAMNINKIDVFYFVDKLRYPENIAYDLAEWFNFTLAVYCIYILIPTRKYRDYVKPFLIVSFLGLPAYFLFYSQFVTLFTIPFILIIQIWRIWKNHAKKRNNTW